MNMYKIKHQFKTQPFVSELQSFLVSVRGLQQGGSENTVMVKKRKQKERRRVKRPAKARKYYYHCGEQSNSYLYGVRMLRGGGSSHVWKVSCIGMGKDVRSNSCWSWMVELLKAFLMVMSWRDTEERAEKEEIHETKPSHQGTLVIFLNSNARKTFLTELSWSYMASSNRPCMCDQKNLIQHTTIHKTADFGTAFSVTLVISFLRSQMHQNTSTNASCSHRHL